MAEETRSGNVVSWDRRVVSPCKLEMALVDGFRATTAFHGLS